MVHLRRILARQFEIRAEFPGMSLSRRGDLHGDETVGPRAVPELAVGIIAPAVRRAAGSDPAGVEPSDAHRCEGEAAGYRRGWIAELVLNGDPAPAVRATSARNSAGALRVDTQQNES